MSFLNTYLDWSYCIVK